MGNMALGLDGKGEKERKKGAYAEKRKMLRNSLKVSLNYLKLSFPFPYYHKFGHAKYQNFHRGLNDKKLGSMRSFLRLESREHVPSVF